MKVLVAGAHLTPALAVIKKLLEIPDIEIVYIGRKYARDDDSAKSVESEILPKLSIKFIPITAGRLNRFFSFQTIISFIKTPIGFIQAFYYLCKEQPDIIVSFGGFTGLPVVICGWFLSVPSIIHEQGLKMGLANLISSFFTEKIAITFSETRLPEFINKEIIIITGNPIRPEFLATKISGSYEIVEFVKRANIKKKPIILITAGNQGSHFINLLVEDKLSEFTEIAAIIHQTGESKFDDFSNLKKYVSPNYLAKKWIEVADLSYVLDKADLVVSRAGINTLIELSLKSVPVLIIPIPIGSEQREGAKFFTDLGLGETTEEEKLTPDIFLQKIKSMISRKKILKESAGNTKKIILLDGEKRLVQEILLLKHRTDNFELNFKE